MSTKKRGRWSRWGRGLSEGWSLQIGNAFRGAAVRRQRVFNDPPVWEAMVNTTTLGEYDDREAAKARVEEVIEYDMRLVLSDWDAYRAAKQRMKKENVAAE
jgi:hypothetical protein